RLCRRNSPSQPPIWHDWRDGGSQHRLSRSQKRLPRAFPPSSAINARQLSLFPPPITADNRHKLKRSSTNRESPSKPRALPLPPAHSHPLARVVAPPPGYDHRWSRRRYALLQCAVGARHPASRLVLRLRHHPRRRLSPHLSHHPLAHLVPRRPLSRRR